MYRNWRTIALGALAAAALMVPPQSADAQVCPDCDTVPKTKIGDLTGDGIINVFDVVGSVDIAFRNGPRSRRLGADDATGDNVVNVFDVVKFVDIAFRNGQAAFPNRVYALTGRLGAGTRWLICDDSLRYRVVGIASVGENRAELGTTCPDKTDTLIVQVGVTVEGDTSSATPAAFIVRRSGYAQIVGSRTNPITFTSMLAPGARDRGDWGGFVINGCATNNNVSGLNQAEGDGGLGGGLDDNDNSGCYKYLVVEFAGREFTPDNELNGITLNGVGDGTVFEYIQINQNADDGVEWFGGTCNVRNTVLSGCDDDGFDSDLGARWCGQYLIVIQDPTKSSSSNHNGIEWDNHPSDLDSLPRAHPIVSHMTIVGQAHDYTGTSLHAGAHIRHGGAAWIYNTVWTKFRAALDIDHNPPAQRLVDNDSLVIAQSIWYDVADTAQDNDVFEYQVIEDVESSNQVFFNAFANPPLAEIFTNVDYTTFAGTPPDFRPISPANPIGLDGMCAHLIDQDWDGDGVGGQAGDIAILDAIVAGWPCFDTTACHIGAMDASDPDPWYEPWCDFSQF